MTSLQVKNLTFTYQVEGEAVLRDLNFTLPTQKISLLIGQSGAGKSTFLKLLTGLYPEFGGQISQGQVLLDGQEVGTMCAAKRATKIALLFQNPRQQIVMTTFREQLYFILANLNLPLIEINDRIKQVCQQFNLTAFLDRDLLTLSGGELQRVALASVVAMGSEIIILDEPFANIDLKERRRLLELLRDLQVKQGKTILICDHDLSDYQAYVDHVFQLDQTLHEVNRTILAEVKKPAVNLPLAPDLTGDLSWCNIELWAGKRQLVIDSSYRLGRGKIGLLSGQNGVGKSTFFKALIKQNSYHGKIIFDKQDLARTKAKKWARLVGIVFQNSLDQFVKLTVAEELALSLKKSHHPEYWTPARVQAVAQAFGLWDLNDQVCYQLSGGQQKRLQILGMLIMSPPVLLLDEPFSGLDQVSLKPVLEELQTVTVDLQIATLVISHQLMGITPYLDYQLRLEHQKLGW
ncbi:ABC transporter ATP-binding protein [Ligilactobacillus equi]|uniref:ABC transporter ATP-binding protein n=2 Tax=Ligilactobacillus equi TaxID=137357 RepID=V7HTI9_9LACO|nr:ABC transporter ATP-binding protein [Ligilactobacillus equi]ETA73529.1 ABC transporter ATP-binding protein [Ligilactobacillus equi DPC 6820]KRL82026.1 thiamin ABC transporter ATP-binding protein [Ligilactobacillus equi DSM 15833 = JCM 10991]